MDSEAGKQTSGSKPCIFCDAALDTKTKPEHILLDSLGGRGTTRSAICSGCNQTFGSTIDKAMPDRLKHLRNMFQLRSGSGDLPPALSQMDTTNGKISFTNDGRPKPARGAPFTVTQLEEGRWDVSFNVTDEEQLRYYVPHAAAKMGMSEDRLWEQIDGKTATRQTDYVGTVHARFHCDGDEVRRSIAKAALVLLATRTGTQALREPVFAAARDFVAKGSEAFLNEHTTADARQIPSPAYEQLVEAYGPMFNMIYVKSNAQGRVVAYFYLYNFLAWQIVLATADGPANVDIALASNPLDTLRWSNDVAAATPLDFDWLDQPDNAARNEIALQRFSAIMELHQEISRKQLVASALNDVLGEPDHGPDSESQQQLGDVLNKDAIRKLSEKLALGLMRVPSSEDFTISRPLPSTDAPPEGDA